MLSSIGPMELIVVLVIALVILGPKRLPQAGKSLGRGIREFKGAISNDDHDGDGERQLAAMTAPAARPEPAREPDTAAR